MQLPRSLGEPFFLLTYVILFESGFHLLLRLTSNSWAQSVFLPQSPEQLDGGVLKGKRQLGILLSNRVLTSYIMPLVQSLVEHRKYHWVQTKKPVSPKCVHKPTAKKWGRGGNSENYPAVAPYLNLAL